ncbi:MAG: DUF84 family protein [Chlamydiota bacterium]
MKKIFNLLLVNVFLWTSFANVEGAINVVIASKNGCKALAARKAFQEVFPNDEIEIMMCETTSGVKEQPVGQKIALKGAKNRINSLPQELLDKADYVVSIENYIEQDVASQKWQDIGLVLLKKRGEEEEVMALTREVTIPDQFVQLAKDLSSGVSEEGYSYTVGCAIEEYYADRHIDAHDWHREVEFGGVSRGQLLQEAILKASH